MEILEPSLWRQMGFFNPSWLGDKKVHVVGCGATGSHVVDTLTCMGIQNVAVYDFDKVEKHNLPNQIYELEDIGSFKVDALAKHVKRKMGYDIETHNEKVEEIKNLKGYLILCTDSMDVQKSIMLRSARLNPECLLVIETRMGIDNGRVYSFDPNLKSHLKCWGERWYSDEQAGESPCNIKAISGTAKLLASLAAMKVVLDQKNRIEKSDIPLWNEIIIHANGASTVHSWDA